MDKSSSQALITCSSRGHYGQVVTMDRWSLWTGGHFGLVVLYTGFIVLTVHVHTQMYDIVHANIHTS